MLEFSSWCFMISFRWNFLIQNLFKSYFFNLFVVRCGSCSFARSFLWFYVYFFICIVTFPSRVFGLFKLDIYRFLNLSSTFVVNSIALVENKYPRNISSLVLVVLFVENQRNNKLLLSLQWK